MPTRLTTAALEEGTFVISFAITDEDGDPAVPTALSWSLTDEDGTAINNRTDVVIDPPVASDDILLSGDDLALQTGERHYAWRILALNGTYNSDLGSGLPIEEEVWFMVIDLVNK